MLFIKDGHNTEIMVYKKEVLAFRHEKDKFFKESHHSPLTENQRKKFGGLEYFPVDEKYRLKLKLHRISNPERVTMQTSDGLWRDYDKIGYFDFEIDGEKARVYVYQSSDNPDYYFIPFKDATSGKETYGAGRYVEIEPAGNDEFILDFNMAYNPYCAYNGRYSCPIPPRENWLPIRIEAGEKSYPDPEY